MTEFVLFTFKRKRDVLNQEVLCVLCRQKSPLTALDLTPKERANGYEQIITPYVGDLPCAECGATPVKGAA